MHCVGDRLFLQKEGVLLGMDPNQSVPVFPEGRLLAVRVAQAHVFCLGDEAGRLLRVFDGSLELKSETRIKTKQGGEAFDVAPDGLTVVLGGQDGSIVLLKAKSLEEGFKESTLVEA